MTRAFWVKVLLGWAILTSGVVFLVTRAAPLPGRAIAAMGCAVFMVWVLVLGGSMYRGRDLVKKAVLAVPLPWWVKFILFSLGLAMLEEVITTSLTNLAPLFGARVGEAYITASANYWDVICYHSIIMFVPGILVWAWLLSRYAFNPTDVFLLWGIFGFVAELGFSGVSQALAFGFWIFVYGLMMYLPAYSLPQRNAKPPRYYHYALSLVLPFLGLIPFYIVFGILSKLFPNSYFGHFPTHPRIDFPS